jgi:rSAM/selenodomain-associated transferase 1
MSRPDALIVFLKEPRAGFVKTRLVPALGTADALLLYRALAEEEVRRTEPQAGDYTRLFFFAPAEARAKMEAWFPGETWTAQVGDDLGARMSAAFEVAFRRGAGRTAIVGSDVPWVSRETVLEALRRLDDSDVVLGPSEDGGYYLMALSRPQPALFSGIPWSTRTVLGATVERAGALGLSVQMLDVLPDIDTIEDVRSAWGRLQGLVPEPLRSRVQSAAFGGRRPV